MTADRLLRDGRLTEAIDQVERDVVTRPDDLEPRTFLFELLVFTGALDRAGETLEEIERLDSRPEARMGVQTYRLILQAEQARFDLFDKGGVPQFLSAPTRAIELHLEAIKRLRDGRTSEAREALDLAAGLHRQRRGFAGGKAFDTFRDDDDLLAPVLEVITAAGYHWVPWEDIQLLVVPPPEHLRDLFWAPARLATNDGMLGEVYLPNLYPGSHRHPDDAVRLGRMTVWSDVGSGIVRGAGRKTFGFAEESQSLLEIGEIRFTIEASEQGGPNPE